MGKDLLHRIVELYSVHCTLLAVDIGRSDIRLSDFGLKNAWFYYTVQLYLVRPYER